VAVVVVLAAVQAQVFDLAANLLPALAPALEAWTFFPQLQGIF
jgi:hypothetical protein